MVLISLLQSSGDFLLLDSWPCQASGSIPLGLCLCDAEMPRLFDKWWYRKKESARLTRHNVCKKHQHNTWPLAGDQKHFS